MGSLHQGHISLLEQSTIENNVTVCSIYVNPTQFNDKKDFEKYPRDIKRDEHLLKRIKCDILFLPSDHEMYPDNKANEDYGFMNGMDILEGEKRPGHFYGVLTIVHTLFKVIQPDRAYFGEKDYQQLWLIKQFVAHKNMPIEIRGCPTIRAEDGLALSSRNERLTLEEKKIALSLFSAMNNFKKEIQRMINKTSNYYLKTIEIESLKKTIARKIYKNPHIKLDYFEVIDVENFSFAKEIHTSKDYRVFIAAHIAQIRLIDNTLIVC